MYRTRSIKFDLGLPNLWPQWKSFFSTRYLLNDISAGVTVACVAIPLSLAIALASGVAPAVGLVSAIIGGIICALFGGTPLSISGPAAAMSILIANSVEKFGVTGIIFMCLMIGIMQLVSGLLHLGRLSRFVPLPVIAAFTSGIGVIIIIGQLPRVFGLPQPSQSHIVSVLSHLAQYINQTKPATVILVVATIAIIRLLPKFLPRLSSTLVAVVVATVMVHLFSMSNIAVIGDIPRTLPAPVIPQMPSFPFSELVLSTFTIYLLACLETLLSSSAIDKLAKTEKHDSDQELIGQGLGNIMVSLFGGIPITGVIARSAVNVNSGAKTRRASIIHALVILASVYFAAPLIALIPIAALAGVLLSVAFSMINYQEFMNLLKTARGEAAIYVITFLMIIFVDLTAGVQIGILSACLVVLIKASRPSLLISHHKHDAIRLSLVGPLTFLSLNKVTDLEKSINTKAGKPIILDLSKLTDLDSSGASAIIDFIHNFQHQDVNVYLKGLPQRYESIFTVCDGDDILRECTLVSETALKGKEKLIKSFHGRLVHGVQQFHANREEQDRLRDYLADRQDPHTLFITCSDSRILTSKITHTEPGELFIVRNVGNCIPCYSNNDDHSEIAALEFALTQLDISEIVICGHSSCGAIKAACLHDTSILPAHLAQWINRIKGQLTLNTEDISELSKQNVLNQIENLKKYPLVRERLQKNSLDIHGWFIDFELQLIYEWNKKTNNFEPIRVDQAFYHTRAESMEDEKYADIYNKVN